MKSAENLEKLNKFLSAAQLAFRENRLPTAVKYFSTAISYEPDSAEAHFGLYETLAQMNDMTQAIVHLNKALVLDPGNIEFLITHSSILINSGQFSDAADELEIVVKLAPNLSSIWIAYLSAINMACEPQIALSRFRSIEILPPADLIVLIEIARMELNAGERKAAELRIRNFVARDPQDESRQILQAKFLSEIGEDSEVRNIYEELRRKSPGSTAILLASAFSEMHDNATIYRALKDLKSALKIEPTNTELLKIYAECLGRMARYDDASDVMETFFNQNKKGEAEDHFFYAKLLKLTGREYQANHQLELSSKKITTKIKNFINNPNLVNSETAKLARIEIAKGRTGIANQLYKKICTGTSEALLEYPSLEYLHQTADRIKRLKEVVSNRNVFILAHGPSISELPKWIQIFSQYNICFAAVSAFRLLEIEILQTINQQIEVVLNCHYRGIAPRFDHFREFLGRNQKNVFITARWALDRLGRHNPTRYEIEREFNHKLLYTGSSAGMLPATPDNPLRFVFGNALSVLVPIISLAKAKRIFIFGADGVSMEQKGHAKHFGQNNNEFRFDFHKTNLDALTDGLRADTIDMEESVETGLISLENLFKFHRPPIYNVSPNSAISIFPKISYHEVCNILTHQGES